MKRSYQRSLSGMTKNYLHKRTKNRNSSFSDGGQTQHFFADFLVTPGVALETFSSNPDHVQVRDPADFKFEGQLREAGSVLEFPPQNVSLLLARNALGDEGAGQLVENVVGVVVGGG